jgi:hypothetical protein
MELRLPVKVLFQNHFPRLLLRFLAPLRWAVAALGSCGVRQLRRWEVARLNRRAGANNETEK